MRIISSSNLKVDKSILTGESEPVRAAAAPITRSEVPLLAASNMAFMGCGVVEGGGTGVIVASGANNQVGKIAAQTLQPQRLTTLQVEVNRFVIVIAAFAIITGAVVIAVSMSAAVWYLCWGLCMMCPWRRWAVQGMSAGGRGTTQS